MAVENAGHRLKTARIAAGFKSAKEFCDKFGIKSSTYSLHETGGRNLKTKIAENYADFLGVDLAWLLTGSGRAYKNQINEDPRPSYQTTFMGLTSPPKNNPNIQNALQAFARKMIDSADIQPTDRVLVIGPEDGNIAAEIARLTSNGQVVGCHSSQQAIQQATRQLTPNPQQNLGFMVMDPKANIFKSQFDVVFSFYNLHWGNDQLSALKGIRAALVENGKAVLLVPLRHDPLYSAIESVVAAEKWQPYFAKLNNPHVFFSKPQYKTLLEQAGLRHSLLAENTLEYPFNTQYDIEIFLNSLLPHTKRIPPALRNDFMREISNIIMQRVPPKDGAVTLTLLMLGVLTYRPCPCHSQRTSSTSVAHSRSLLFGQTPLPEAVDTGEENPMTYNPNP